MGVLEPTQDKSDRVRVRSKFQSLEGIWGFWNAKSWTHANYDRQVSIPGRDLGVLEPSQLAAESLFCLVSIPGRDLGVLEHQRVSALGLEFESFNPWKGFGGFGTSDRCSHIWR